MGRIQGLPAEYIHEYVDHAVEYVKGNVHTNGLENFFSLLKRMVRGTYVQVSTVAFRSVCGRRDVPLNERVLMMQGDF